MNRTFAKLLIKLSLTFLAALIAFYVTSGGALFSLLLLTLVAAGLNYAIGDLLILPSYGNLVASLGDGGLAAATAYAYGQLDRSLAATGASLLVFALLIAGGEFFFHRYLRQDNPTGR